MHRGRCLHSLTGEKAVWTSCGSSGGFRGNGSGEGDSGGDDDDGGGDDNDDSGGDGDFIFILSFSLR